MAILNFRNEKDLTRAITQTIQIGDCPLQWISREVRICRTCSSPNHQTDYCSDIPNPTYDKKGNIVPYQDRYRPAYQRPPNTYRNYTNNRSYADTVRGKQDAHLSITQDTIKDIRDALTEMMNEIRNIKNRVTLVEKRLNNLENSSNPLRDPDHNELDSMEKDSKSISSRLTILDETEITDIKHQQAGINDQLKRMEDIMSATIAAVAEISPNSSNTPSKHGPPSPRLTKNDRTTKYRNTSHSEWHTNLPRKQFWERR
jgi:uncharacterized coiled-coil protein SlyX